MCSPYKKNVFFPSIALKFNLFLLLPLMLPSHCHPNCYPLCLLFFYHLHKDGYFTCGTALGSLYGKPASRLAIRTLPNIWSWEKSALKFVYLCKCVSLWTDEDNTESVGTVHKIKKMWPQWWKMLIWYVKRTEKVQKIWNNWKKRQNR